MGWLLLCLPLIILHLPDPTDFCGRAEKPSLNHLDCMKLLPSAWLHLNNHQQRDDGILDQALGSLNYQQGQHRCQTLHLLPFQRPRNVHSLIHQSLLAHVQHFGLLTDSAHTFIHFQKYERHLRALRHPLNLHRWPASGPHSFDMHPLFQLSECDYRLSLSFQCLCEIGPTWCLIHLLVDVLGWLWLRVLCLAFAGPGRLSVVVDLLVLLGFQQQFCVHHLLCRNSSS